MKARRRFIRKLGSIMAALAIGSAARANRIDHPEDFRKDIKTLEGGFFHIVFFWLTDDSPDVREKFLDELNRFIDQVEEIKKVHVGPPADTDRDVIDNTYSYNLLVTFDSKKDHDIYQEHPAHKTFIANASSLWTKVLVYDSIN